MSDTQGASDTASGGLENDMPGIGAAAPSPRMVPSPLSGIAAFASQLIGGGGVQPGRSAQRRPQFGPPQDIHPDAPRWQGTTASLFVPKGFSQPAAKFTPFIRTMPKGDWQNWGKPDEGGMQPQSFELPGIYQGLSQFFGGQGNGGGLQMLLALGMGRYAGDYMKGVIAGEEYKANMALEQMKLNAMKLQEHQEQMHTTYANDYQEWFEAAGEDKSKMATTLIKGQSLHDRLAQDAYKIGDKDFADLIESGASFDQLMHYQDERDSRYKDLAKANSKLEEQQAEDAKVRADLGIPDSGTQGGGPTGGRHPWNTSGAPATSAPAPSPGSPATSPVPPTGAPGSPSLAQGDGQQTGQEQQGDPSMALQPYQEIGNNVYKGEANLNQQSKAGREAISRWAADQGNRVDQVLAKAKRDNLTPDQTAAAVEKVIPGMGDDWINAYHGSPIPTGVLGRSPYWQAIRRSAVPDPVTQQATIKDFASSGKSGLRVTAGTRMGEAGVEVLREGAKIGNQPIPLNIIEQWISKGVVSDPRFSNFFAALNTYMQEHQSLQSSTGRWLESEMQEQRKNINITQGMPAVRGLLRVDAINAANFMQQLQDAYHHGSRQEGPSPTYSQSRFDILKALTGINDQTGFRDIPDENLPPELRGVDKGGGGGAWKPPAGWTITPMQ